jgi:hypothetical protein
VLSGPSAAKLIEHEQRRVLDQRARDEQATVLAVGELPAGFAELLRHARWHPIVQVAQAELSTHGFSLRTELGARGPGRAHQHVEREARVDSGESSSELCA